MLKTLFDIAVRHLFGRRRQTMTTIFGVAISTMVLITTNSLMRGLLDSFVETLVNVAPHITVKGEKTHSMPLNLIDKESSSAVAFIDDNIQKLEREEVRNYRQILALFSSNEYEKKVLAASPYVESQVMAVKGSRNQPLLLKGVLIEKEDAISGIRKKLIQGDITMFEKTSNALLVGRTVARDMNLKLNDQLVIIPASGKSRQCKVAGIFFPVSMRLITVFWSLSSLVRLLRDCLPTRLQALPLKCLILLPMRYLPKIWNVSPGIGA